LTSTPFNNTDDTTIHTTAASGGSLIRVRRKEEREGITEYLSL